MPPTAQLAAPPAVIDTGAGYLGPLSYADHLRWLQTRHPDLAALVDPRFSDPAAIDPLIAEMNRVSWEFEDAGAGRGASYNVAQRVIENRSVGMRRLLALFAEPGAAMPGRGTVILDALAGDGTIRRFVDAALPEGPQILSADISRFMVARCRDQGFPCLRQPASKSLIGDHRLDGVLIAYGSHHLDDADRQAAADEARRTLKPGRRFVLHDFPQGGAVDAWFAQVVHPYSTTGHPHRHFDAAEMARLMTRAGFAAHRVFEMSDPFVVPGATPEAARLAMLRHLHAMYGLDKLPLATAADIAALDALVRATLGEIRIARAPRGYRATLDRSALIAVGTA